MEQTGDGIEPAAQFSTARGVARGGAPTRASEPPSSLKRRSAAGAVLLVVTAVVGTGLWLARTSRSELPPVSQPARSLLIVDRPSNRSVAERRARQLIAEIRLPRGDHLGSTEPDGMPSGMRQADQRPGTPYLVDLGRFWVTNMTQQRTLGWLSSHGPRGASASGSGTWGNRTLTADSLEFSWAARGVLALEWMQVSVVPYRTGSLARFDAQVVYYPQRPSGEEVPPGIDRIAIAVAGTSGGSRSLTVIDSTAISRIEELVAAMRGSPMTFQPGGPCLDLHSMTERYRLDFYSSGRSAPVAVVTGRPWSIGLDNVTMTVEGRAEPDLADSGLKLGHLVAKIVGVTWPSPYC